MKTKIYSFLILFTLFLQPILGNNPEKNEFYDELNEIKWKVYTVDNLLKIDLKFTDPTLIHKISTQGLKLYIDVKAKKKKIFYVNYPIVQAINVRKALHIENQNPTETPPVPHLSNNAMINKYGKEISLNVLEENKYLDLDITRERDLFVYRLTLPLDYLKTDKIKSFSKISIGLESKREIPNQKQMGNRPGMQGKGMGRKSAASGQRPRGQGMGKGRTSNQNQFRPSEEMIESMKKPFSVWYKIEL